MYSNVPFCFAKADKSFSEAFASEDEVRHIKLNEQLLVGLHGGHQWKSTEYV